MHTHTRDVNFGIEVFCHFEDPGLHLFLDVAVFLLRNAESQLQDVKPIGMVHQHAMHLVTDSRVLVMNWRGGRIVLAPPL